MIDRRYPYLVALHDAPGLASDRRCALAAFADALLERAGCRALFDCRSGHLFVHLAHDITQGLALPPPLTMLRHKAGWDWSVLDKLDELCRVIRSGRVSWHVRDWMDGFRKKAVAAEEASEARKHAEDMAEEIKSMYEHCKSRMGMGKTFKRSALVSGLRG